MKLRKRNNILDCYRDGAWFLFSILPAEIIEYKVISDQRIAVLVTPESDNNLKRAKLYLMDDKGQTISEMKHLLKLKDNGNLNQYCYFYTI